MAEEDLMDEDLQGLDQGESADDQDALPLPAVTPPQPAPAAPAATGLDALPPNWWIRKEEPQIDYGRVNAIRDLYNAVPAKEANQAVEMATRLQGVLGFDADVKAGVPTVEALRKWAPKMYFNHPGAVSRLVQPPTAPFQPGVTNVGGQRLIQTSPNRWQLLPAPAATNTGNIQAVPIMTPEGKQLGFGVQSKSGVHTRWNTEGAGQPKVSDMIHAYNTELRGLQKEIEAAELSGNRTLQAQKEKEHSAVLQELSTLRKNFMKPPAPTATATNESSGGLPVVTTKEQYDALPSGAIYLNGKSNRKHRKP